MKISNVFVRKLMYIAEFEQIQGYKIIKIIVIMEIFHQINEELKFDLNNNIYKYFVILNQK